MKRKSLSKKTYPERAGQLPITQKMLYGVRDEMMSKFISLEHKVVSHDHRFISLESRIDSLENKMTSEFQSIKSDVHRVLVLVEEQNARNAVVFDGLTSLFSRQERVEKRLDGLGKT